MRLLLKVIEFVVALNLDLVFSKPALDSTINSYPVIDLPDGFLIGAATSAYQVEGATNENGKSESYMEWLMHLIAPNVSADVASDSYHMYKEDVKVLEYTKLDIYRFSMSWARLLPNGHADFINEDGVKYYHSLLDELEKIEVEPLVFLHHFDHPIVLDQSDIWQNGEIIELFTRYARFIFQEFGSRVKNFVTFNEANMLCYQMISREWLNNYGNESKRLAKTYACGHNVLKAHAQVYHMYHEEFNPNGDGKVSISIECENFYLKNQGDELFADVAFQFGCGWLAHPIYSRFGDYHEIVKQWVQENSLLENLTESRLPVFSDEWIEKIRGSADYFGLSHYSSHLVEPASLSYDGETLIDSLIPSDSRLIVSEPYCDTATNGYCVAPEGFRNILRKISGEYDNPIIYVIENGYPDDGRLNDTKRMKFLYSYIREAVDAINDDKIYIKGYIYWSLIDGFEFNRAYDMNFGLAHVDVDSAKRTRTLRKSAMWLRNVIETRKLYVE